MNRPIFCHLRKRHFDLKDVFVGKKPVSSSLTSSQNFGATKLLCSHKVIRTTPCPAVFINSIHTSSLSRGVGSKKESDVTSKPTRKTRKRNTRSQKEDEELQSAAVNAAKSLPGDWTRIAEELMSRLAVQEDTSKEPRDEGIEQSNSNIPSSLLSTMKVSRNFESAKGGSPFRDSQRRTERYGSLYSQAPLGIFDAKKMRSEAGKTTAEDKDSLWQVVSKENIKRIRGGLPRNGFEETIQWTKEGRMWTFPIDNEEDMHEERQYKFHQHVFLSHHLEDFPADGPIRRFMDLVVTGLSKNSWVSVPEKVEHIRWYADYFRQKQQLLESSIGDKAKMKQS